MSTIEPYTIAVPQGKIDRLKQKLALTDFPDEVEGVGWDRGVPLAELRRLVSRWQDGFDWRKAEQELNLMPQFTTDISVDGFEPLKIHFVHKRSARANAIPLLFVHGWPGHFDEVSKLLEPLTNPTGDTSPAFHVVAPSLPGFGFSEGSRRPGFRIRHIAAAFHQLMRALGYPEFATQGGDLGCFVTRRMGQDFPGAVRASHINMPRPSFPSPHRHPELYLEAVRAKPSEWDKRGAERTAWFTSEGRGYNLLQSTKPQTIGYAVTDSPAGLLAWVYEKLHDWADDYPWTDDEILKWVSIYYFSTAGPAASQRIYYELKRDPDRIWESVFEYVKGPKLGTANFPKELVVTPKLWNKTLGPLVLASQWDRGGHFAAYERPDAIVQDLRDMFGNSGGAFGVVGGVTGCA